MDSETKWLVAQERAGVDDILRNIKLPCGSEKIKILAARISTGAEVTNNGMLCGEGIIGSMVSKLSEEKQSRWILFLGEGSDREKQEAFDRWQTIQVRAAEIFRHQKWQEAWFRAEDNYQVHPSEVKGS